MVTMPRGAPLKVALTFVDGASVIPTARVAMDDGLAQLEWSSEIIKRQLNVSAYRYPPESGLQEARTRTFGGLHGFLSDSMPEGWAMIVMRRRLRKLGVDIATLAPLEHLALVGANGRGALTFEPVTTPPADVDGGIDLDALAQESAAILSGEDGELTDILAKAAGGSGGARPKVNVGFGPDRKVSVGSGEVAPGHSAWIVKFRAPSDPSDIGPIEEAYALMAEAAGLTMSAHKLIPAKKGAPYFATERFDRPAPGKRLHMVSLAGAVEASTDPSVLDYDKFLRATHAITRNKDDVISAFRRMVFNVLAHNRDDHSRQHAYLMDEAGDWKLSPAYDLTYSPGPGGEHYLDIEGEGGKPKRKDVEAIGERHGISKGQMSAIIDEVRDATASWKTFADAANVGKNSTTMVSDAIGRVAAGF